MAPTLIMPRLLPAPAIIPRLSVPVGGGGGGAEAPEGWDDVGHSGSLTDYSGATTITSDDVTLENFRFPTRIELDNLADNLTIRNSFFDCTGINYCLNNQYNQTPNSNSGLVEDTTFVGANSAALILGGASDWDFRRCRFRDCRADFIKQFGTSNARFEDCYFGGLSRTEFGQVAYDAGNGTSFTPGDTLTGGTSGDTGVITKVEETTGTTGIVYFKNPTGVSSSTDVFLDGETITDQSGASATVNEPSGTGTYEDIHSDGVQNNGSPTTTFLRTTFDFPAAVNGEVRQVTSGSWLESNAESVGGVIGDIKYRATIGIFFDTDSGGTLNVHESKFKAMGTNGIRCTNGSTTTVNIGDNLFWPSGIYDYKSGNGGTYNDEGGNQWAVSGNDLKGNARTAGEAIVF